MEEDQTKQLVMLLNMNDSNEFQVMNNIHSKESLGNIDITSKQQQEQEQQHLQLQERTIQNNNNNQNEKRRRTNYSLGGNKLKIEEAVKYLLDLSERARPNVRNVAEKVFFPSFSLSFSLFDFFSLYYYFNFFFLFSSLDGYSI